MGKRSSRYEHIIIASAKLFRKRGYLATSIRDIGDALGITSAALYYHFKNKEELLLAIMNESLDRVLLAVTDIISKEEDPGQRIQLGMREHLRISTEYQDAAIVVLQEIRHLSPEGLHQVIAKRDAYDHLWNSMFEEAREAGLYRADIDLRLARLLTFGAMNMVVTWYKQEGTYQPEEIADRLFEYARDGIMNPELRMSLNP